jgi:hypothetical protein
MSAFDDSMLEGDLAAFREMASPRVRVDRNGVVLDGIVQPVERGTMIGDGGEAAMADLRVDVLTEDAERWKMQSGMRVEVREPGVGWRAWRVARVRYVGGTAALFLMPTSGMQGAEF